MGLEVIKHKVQLSYDSYNAHETRHFFDLSAHNTWSVVGTEPQ